MSDRRDGWWTEGVDSPEDIFYQMGSEARMEDQGRREKMVEHLCLYSNQTWDEYGPAERSTGNFERITQNHIENMVHTVHAECVQNRTRMTVVTSGGDYRMKKRAKDLDKFSEGQAYEDNQEEVGFECKLDAIIWGTGVEKPYTDQATRRVKGDRLPSWHLHAPRSEARFGLRSLRTIYEDAVFDREVLKSIYNSKETDDIIDAAPRNAIDDYPYSFDKDSNLIIAQEGFHLPTRPKNLHLTPEQEAKDGEGKDDEREKPKGGRHMIVVPGAGGKRGGLLSSEPWEKDSFPYVFIYWIRPRLGLWGKGLVEQLLGQQIEHNRIGRHIQLSMKRAGNLKVFIDAASGVIKTQLNDKVGTLITYNSQGGGHKPEYVVHDVVSPQLIAYKQQLGAEMYNVEGISQQASQGMLPQGMDKASGRAIRTADSISSRRRLPFLKDCEQFDRRVAEAKIELAQEAAEQYGEYAVAYHGNRAIEMVDWKRVNLKRDQWFMRVYPTSALPPEPGARIATLDEWLNAGLIDKATYKRMADFPDLEDAETLESAAYSLGEEIIDLILYEGQSFVPEPILDNKLFATMGLKAYNRAKLEGLVNPKAKYPEAHMDKLRDWIVACATPPKAPSTTPALPADPNAMPPPAAEGAPPGMPPDAGGMPPPMNGAPPPINQAGPPPGPPS